MDKPNGDDVDRGPAVVAILWAQTAVSVLVVALRLWGKIFIRKFGADDILMIFTLCLMIAFAAISTYLASVGGFRHLYYMTPEQQKMAVRLNWISQPFVIFGLTMSKSSVALLIVRFLGPNMKVQRIMLYMIIASTILISVLNIIFTYVQCRPTQALWDIQLQKPGACWNPNVQRGTATLTAVWNVVDDVLLAAIPATIIWKLQLSLKKRIGLSMLLGLGIMAAIMGAVKTSFIANLSARSDLTWKTYDLYTWSNAELFVTIFCGCVPGIKPLYDHYIGKKHQSLNYTPYVSSSTGRARFAKRSGDRSGERSGTTEDDEGIALRPCVQHGSSGDTARRSVGGQGIIKQTRIEVMSERDGRV